MRQHAAGHPTYHVNVIKLKWEIIWTGGLPHLSRLPHLPGVPRLNVNRPLIMKKKVSTTWNRRVLAIVKQECQCKHGNRMRRRIRRNLSVKVQQVFLSVFACSVLLNKEVLYSGHALDQGYLQGVHISSQSRDLVNAFWWCCYLDNHLSFQILTSQVIKFVLKQTAEWAILSQGCLRPLCWSTNVWAVLQQMCIKQSWILKWTFNYACWGFFNVV